MLLSLLVWIAAVAPYRRVSIQVATLFPLRGYLAGASHTERYQNTGVSMLSQLVCAESALASRCD